MKTLHKLVSGLCAAGIILLSSTVSAAPVVFNITAAAFTPGAGYGQDASETSGATLLDVRFSTSAFSTQNFTLSAGGFSTFNFGTIGLHELNAGGGIIFNETNLLNVTAALTFVSPVGTPQTLFATGTATVGPVNDSDIDYTIDWAPIFVTFGAGGLFQIDLTDLAFHNSGADGAGEIQTQLATIRLMSEAGIPPTGNVPEPSTVALLGLGLLGAAVTRRKLGARSA